MPLLKSLTELTPLCPYCGSLSVLTDSAEVYRGRSYGPIYLCRPCDAYVGCHRQGGQKGQPLGTLANAELRKARNEVHVQFDRLWKDGDMHRGIAYNWLHLAMDLPREKAHIAMFTLEQCRKAIHLLTSTTTTLP